MFTYFVNSNTSVIPILSRNLSTGEYSLVYIPPTDEVGQMITIRDMDGYLSTPQYFLISTTSNALITGGVSTLKIQQGYGYLTLKAKSSAEWSIVDQNAFPNPVESYSIRGLTYNAINTIKDASIYNTVSSTGLCRTRNYVAFSTSQSFGPLFGSSIQVNTTGVLSDIYMQAGSLYITSNININSSINIQNNAAINGNVSVRGSLSTGNSIAGSILFSTNTGVFNVKNTLSSGIRLLVNNTISTGGTVSISSLTRIFDNLYTSTLRTSAYNGTLLNTNEIVFSPTTYIRERPDIQVVSDIYTGITTPIVDFQQGLTVVAPVPQSSILYLDYINTSNVNTANLVVTNTISSPNISNVNIQNALILNQNGIVYVSSVATGSMRNSTIFGPGNSPVLPYVSTGAITASSIGFRNFIQNRQNTVVDNIITDSCSTHTTTTSSLIFGQTPLNVDGLSLRDFFVSTSFIGNGMSSLSAPNSIINNRERAFFTSNVFTNTAMTSSIFGTNYITSASQINISSPNVSFSNMNIGTTSTTQSVICTLYGSAITFGQPLTYSTISPSGPYTTTSTISGFSTNTEYEFIKGQGIPYNPLQIKASFDRTVNIYFQNTSTFATRFLTFNYTYQNNGSAVGSAGIRMVNNGIISTIVSFNASPIQTIQKASLSNFPVNPNTISPSYQYYLTGPTTYLPPSTVVSRNIVIAGGTSPAATLSYSSDGGRTWTPLRFTNLTSSCMGLARGSDKWIAAGEGVSTTLMVSYTGTLWYPLGKSIFTIRGKSVAWNGSLWVAVGEGTNSIAYSKDGISWTGLGTSIFTVGNAVAWNGTRWVATGSNINTLAYSTDGSNWTGVGTTTFTQAGNAVAWNGFYWVAVGQGTNTIAYSANGSTWTGLGTSVFQNAGTAVAWNGLEWVSGSSNDSINQIATSPDGSNWTGVAVPTLSNVNGLTYSASNWIATGQGSNSFATSPNGSNWTGVTRSTIFRQGYCVANSELLPRGASTLPGVLPVIAAGDTANLFITTNNTSWTSVSSPFTTTVSCIAWNGVRWIAGGSGTNVLAYSANGLSWTGIALPNMTAVKGVAYGPSSTWLAVGTGAGGFSSASSTNGISWTEINYSTGSFFENANGIAWAGNLWVAVGATLGGGIAFSLDGITWIPQADPMFATGNTVCTNGSFWLAGGTPGTHTLAYSYNGAVWIGLGTTLFSGSVLTIAFGNNIWVAAGTGTNSLAYSFDGLIWYGLGTTIFTVGRSVTWNGTRWFATGQGANTLAYSLDGLLWIGLGTTVFASGGTAIVSQTILPNSAINVNEPVGIRWDLSGVVALSPSILENPLNSLIQWNSRASSLDGYAASASLSFSLRQPNVAFMIGFSELPRTTNSFTALNYAFYITTTNTVELYELGVNVLTVGSITITATFLLEFTGLAVNYYVNSVLVRSVPRAVGNPLYFSSSFRSPGARVDNVEFHPIYRITDSPSSPNEYSYLASITPARDDQQYISYSMPMPASGLSVGKWQFDFPISGNLSTTSTSIYADFCVNNIKLFSTPVLSNVFYTTPSTYSLAFNVSTAISTLTTDTLSIRFRTLRGTGESYFYNTYSTPTTSLSTSVRNDIYNLSSIAYLQLYHTSFGSGLQTSDMNMWLSPISTNSQSYIDSNVGITMNMGFMKWTNRLYGISIQNRYNDMQGRNITYSGALYNASDSNLKHSIEYADVSTLYDSIDSLPLRYYTFNHAYLSTFQPADRHQLGVLTTEVRPLLPTIVNEVRPAELGLSTLETIDKAQLKFAHLGATQWLIQRVSSLSGRIASLK
jgi:hypothetical protein